ncbi:hypothetical protein MMC28_010012 [Mycoblastus sanguinarius]|nr:hypothetical protein [Mycoblastus sanguinarius]
MPLPTPPVPLKDHCSIIYNDTLYTYQVNAFQSLPLTDGATWTKLPMGVATNGSTCVQGSINGQDSLIVVGGSTTTQNFLGLQSYSFVASKWQTDNPTTNVTENRQNHGTAYLNQTSSILMYAGSQSNDYLPSSQTFLISTSPPYNIQSFVDSVAPPATKPLMLSWNATHALMLGGGQSNTKLFTFGPDDGWHQLDVCLPNGLKDSTKVQATILDGSDGSKVLEIFDMSTSPNQISTLLLQNATSTSNSSKKARSYVPSAHHPAKRRKRDTTLANRPAYNNTLAPQDTRDGFSLAEDPKTGVIVATGGGDQVPFAMFNQTGNQWIDPNEFFGNEPSPTSSSAAPTSDIPTTTPSPAQSSQSAATQPPMVKNKSLTILGGVLGGVFGFAALLILILLLLRFCRGRREKKRQQRANDYPMEDKEEMDFADVGAEFMKEAGGRSVESNHQRNKSKQSDPGLNVPVTDRAGAASSQSKRALLHAKGDSAGSGKSFWSRGTKSPEKSPPTISGPIMGSPVHALAPQISPDPRTEPRTDTGWSRYFTDNNSKENVAGPSANEPETRPQTYLSGSQDQSSYASSCIASSHPHESAEVEPLNIRASQNASIYPPNTRVMSPTGFPRPGLGPALTHQSGPTQNNEPPTPSTLVSDIDEEDEYTQNSHSDGQDSWTPVAAAGERDSTWTEDRPVSSVHANSMIYPHPGERVRIPNFPPVPDSQRPSAANSGVTSPISPSGDPGRGLRNIASRDFARTDTGRQRIPPQADDRRGLASYGVNQVRTFPRRQEELGARGRGSSQTEDMSWLNLGTSAEQSNHVRYAGQ